MWPPDQVATVTAQLLQGGIDILQLRAKEHPKTEIVKYAEAMLPLTKAAGVPLILNDYPDLLREVDADGCHVGQEDFGVAEARDLAGRDCIVGKSTHTLAQAQTAEQRGSRLHRLRAVVSNGNQTHRQGDRSRRAPNAA